MKRAKGWLSMAAAGELTTKIKVISQNLYH